MNRATEDLTLPAHVLGLVVDALVHALSPDALYLFGSAGWIRGRGAPSPPTATWTWLSWCQTPLPPGSGGPSPPRQPISWVVTQTSWICGAAARYCKPESYPEDTASGCGTHPGWPGSKCGCSSPTRC